MGQLRHDATVTDVRLTRTRYPEIRFVATCACEWTGATHTTRYEAEAEAVAHQQRAARSA